MFAWAVEKKQKRAGDAGRVTVKVERPLSMSSLWPEAVGTSQVVSGEWGVFLGPLLTWACPTSLWADQFLCVLQQSSSINLKQKLKTVLSFSFPELLLGQGPRHPGGEQ